MIGVTKLLCGSASPGDVLRYGGHTSKLPAHLLQFSQDKKPVVVWNVTRRCNLHCIHCYASAEDRKYPGEITSSEGVGFVDSLASYGVPVLLLSGGEPLIRPDLLKLASVASARGIRVVLSTNGTLITPFLARKIKEAGVSYAGISLDGLGEANDQFRGKAGAYQEALAGIRACTQAGVRVGLRFTLTRRNYQQVPDIFDLVEEEAVPRLCFYHLVYSGRGSRLRSQELSPQETRRTVDLIFDRALDFHRRGIEKDILTVDNHADAAYLYLRVKAEEPQRAQEVLQLLRWNGGNSSGVGIACVDSQGEVHPDQFWQHYSLGSIRHRPFPEIWEDTSDPLLAGLKEKKRWVKGRCSLCSFLDICGGNMRVRAEAVYGDVWAPDPACYLTDQEIGIA